MLACHLEGCTQPVLWPAHGPMAAISLLNLYQLQKVSLKDKPHPFLLSPSCCFFEEANRSLPPSLFLSPFPSSHLFLLNETPHVSPFCLACLSLTHHGLSLTVWPLDQGPSPSQSHHLGLRKWLFGETNSGFCLGAWLFSFQGVCKYLCPCGRFLSI